MRELPNDSWERFRLIVKKKNNNVDIHPVPREAIAPVRGEEDFVELLRRELD
jgi:hypothetical protein